MGRDVDSLEPVPDAALASIDTDYLVKHEVDSLLSSLLQQILEQRPRDPIQYIIDSVSLGPHQATQDALTGLPEHRRTSLEQVFNVIAKDPSGGISLRKLQAYASQHGGQHLSADELSLIFADFRSGDASIINLGEFLAFFAKVSRTMSNAQFGEMVAEMAR